MLIRALAAGALAGALAGCAQHAASSNDGAPAAAYQAELRAEQKRLAELDRTRTARRRAEIARVVTGSARDVTPGGAMTERFVVTVTNHARRTIRRIVGGLVVYPATGAQRLGLSTFSVALELRPGATARVPVAIPLTAFAIEGAGALARASGTPKRVDLDLTAYAFDGAERADAD
ncbi:MAG TPA: hypothetical protein VIW69_03245 [Candidatus Elarobacter sp.]